jgi:uncharacterized damage-inducible protein DinB
MKVSHFFSHWIQIRADLLVTIDKFSDDELSFVPVRGGWPIGIIMLHIGEAEEGWFRYVIKRKIDRWPIFELEDYPTKEAIKTLLTEIHDQTEAYLATLSLADLEQEIEPRRGDQTSKLGWIIWHVLEHEIHHRGELSFILGLLGREGLDN